MQFWATKLLLVTNSLEIDEHLPQNHVLTKCVSREIMTVFWVEPKSIRGALSGWYRGGVLKKKSWNAPKKLSIMNSTSNSF